MFHIYEGFHLVETYHKIRYDRKYHPADGTKRAIKIALVALITLLLWNMPAALTVLVAAFILFLWIGTRIMKNVE